MQNDKVHAAFGGRRTGLQESFSVTNLSKMTVTAGAAPPLHVQYLRHLDCALNMMAAAFPGTTMIMAALAISKSRILLLCVGCCSFLMMATLRLNFLVSQASLAGVREDGAPFMRVRRPANNNNASYVEKNVSIEYVRLKQDSSIQRPVSKQGVSIPKLSSAADGAPAEKMENATNIHFPNYFTSQIPLESLIERDNLLSVFSGCSIAAWTYTGVTFHKAKVRFYDDCKCYNDEHNMTGRDVSSHTAVSLLKSSDTLYVELKKISHFVIYTLPKITVDVVLISGQNHLVPQKPQKLDYVWSQDDFDAIVNNPYITHWFMMNMDVYAQDPDHVKVSRVLVDFESSRHYGSCSVAPCTHHKFPHLLLASPISIWPWFNKQAYS
jgi:hypothetical protein